MNNSVLRAEADQANLSGLVVIEQEAQGDIKSLEEKVVNQTAELRDSQAKEQELKAVLSSFTSHFSIPLGQYITPSDLALARVLQKPSVWELDIKRFS